MKHVCYDFKMGQSDQIVICDSNLLMLYKINLK